MSIEYRVYSNGGSGGAVDYTAPVAATSGLSQLITPLSAPSDNTFLVRAHDTVTGYEDQNGDARVRVVIDGSGRDITAQANAPWGLSVIATEGGAARVAWLYNPGGQGGPPSVFNVYAGSPSVDYTSKRAEVAATRSPARIYVANLTGFTDGVTYEIGVRSENASGEEANTATVSFTAVSSGPGAVPSLSAALTP